MYSLVVKSLLLSLLLHLLVCEFFVFTFPVIPPEHKPKFIFLGSILKKQDISGLNSPQGVYPTTTVPKNFTHETKNDKNPFSHNLINKPRVQGIDQGTGKNFSKTTFKLPETKAKPTKPEKGMSLDNLKIDAYKPLRLEDL